MDISTFYPQNATLRNYIDYYYFLKADSPDFKTTYYAYPNTAVPLSIHRSMQFEIKENGTAVQATKDGHPGALLQRSFQQPFLVNLQGPVDKVTICFKAAGMGPFLDRPFSEIAPNDSQGFSDWDALPAYNNMLKGFFGTDDNAERVLLLETFLLSICTPRPEHAVIARAVQLLSDFDNQPSMEEVAAALQLTTRSFNRLFGKHMSISPVAWKKIARFRHSLKNKLFSAHFKKLTEIGYGSNFYDQSYFIKVYNKLTGANPGAFFKSVEKLADDHLIFRFVTE